MCRARERIGRNGNEGRRCGFCGEPPLVKSLCSIVRLIRVETVGVGWGLLDGSEESQGVSVRSGADRDASSRANAGKAI